MKFLLAKPAFRRPPRIEVRSHLNFSCKTGKDHVEGGPVIKNRHFFGFVEDSFTQVKMVLYYGVAASTGGRSLDKKARGGKLEGQ